MGGVLLAGGGDIETLWRRDAIISSGGDILLPGFTVGVGIGSGSGGGSICSTTTTPETERAVPGGRGRRRRCGEVIRPTRAVSRSDPAAERPAVVCPTTTTSSARGTMIRERTKPRRDLQRWTHSPASRTMTPPQPTHLPLHPLDFPSQTPRPLIRRLSIRPRTRELRLLGFDLQDVPGMVLDKLGVLDLQLGELGREFHFVLAEIGGLVAQEVDFGAEVVEFLPLDGAQAAAARGLGRGLVFGR